MASTRLILLAAATLLVIAGCSLTPAPNEVTLPCQDFNVPFDNSEDSQLVIFNDTNKFLYGLDGTGKLNVSTDGRSVGQLDIGEYVVLTANRGKHKIDLEHWDLFHFSSAHEITVEDRQIFLRVKAKATSNEAVVVDRPVDFNDDFNAAF